MMRLVILSCLLAMSTAQWQNNGQYQPQQYQSQGGQNSNNGAPVHYVNIGPQLQGDYKFGYNTGNGGSFREETRNPDGSVSGAYGYIDASGKQKVIKYTAGKDGFKAEGEDIPQAPPAPQPAAQPAYQHQPSYQPQQSYIPPQAHNYNNNYVQHQQSNGYPQQYGQSGQQQGNYNPFAYVTGQGPSAQPQGNQLSYNIGGGNPGHNQYQG